MGIIVMTMILFPFSSHATCTPTPDCDAIGYTETSCEGDSLKCPFDITKLYCIPCDSSYKYTCNRVGETGIGSACGGKYVTCECSAGSVFKNGACACDDSCTVGAIYYSDGTCSSCVDSSKTTIGKVVKDNELIMNTNVKTVVWGTYGIDIQDLPNLTQAQAKEDFNGKENTAILVAAHISEGLTSAKSAAIYCNEYTPTGLESTKGQWYLPAAGEIYNYVYLNYSKLHTTINLSWSSSENSANNAWRIYSNNGSMSGGNKGAGISVTCFLAI